MKRFRYEAPDCYDPMGEGMLVHVRLHGMLEEYSIFLENLSFYSFPKLMEAARRTNEMVHRAPRPSSTSRSSLNSALKKRLIVVTLDKGEGSWIQASP